MSLPPWVYDDEEDPDGYKAIGTAFIILALFILAVGLGVGGTLLLIEVLDNV